MSDLPNYDELVAVRLELARIRDHRDALQAGLTKEIRELIRSELSAQLDAVSCQLVERDDLKAENELLKGQVNYWKIEAECDHGRWQRCLEDMEKLRKEVAYYHMRHAELVADKRRLSDRIEELAEEQGGES